MPMEDSVKTKMKTSLRINFFWVFCMLVLFFAIILLTFHMMCSRGYCSSDEVKMAQSARKKTGEKTVFEKIVDRELPANIIYEDEQTMAFHGLHPTAPVHFLVIPKKLITMLEEAEDSDEQILGRLLLTARKVAKQEGLTNGYRVVINNGPDGAQSIYHLHLHVIGGRQLDWPPG